jgi:hypothetical protein
VVDLGELQSECAHLLHEGCTAECGRVTAPVPGRLVHVVCHLHRVAQVLVSRWATGVELGRDAHDVPGRREVAAFLAQHLACQPVLVGEVPEGYGRGSTAA